eukprot:Skav236400  [mRNA]  locus=scaffold1702:73948:75483:+ [translate_table: standard]
MEDGTLQVIKILHFQDKIHPKDALHYCAGTPYALLSRPGPWAVKKALVSLLDRLPGFHVSWFALDKVNDKPLRRSQSSQRAPADEELWAGIQYINEHAPERDSQNQQQYWALCNIKEDAGTPISGWPEAKVRLMAQNKAKGMAGAQLETAFPLHTFSLKPFMAAKLLPPLYPLFLNFAFMFLGWPGAGKTPAIIAMMLAMGRYHASRLGLQSAPGWRKAKSLDNFRHRAGLVHEGVFLDDPSHDKIDLADLKSFCTAEENQTCHGRYNDVKLAKNCCRAYATNDAQQEDEPPNDQRRSITMEEFLTLLRRTFPGDKPADIRAILKRTVALVFGSFALYLRLPSQRDDAPIHRIQIQDLHKDILADRHKFYYGKYKGGALDKPDDFEADVEKEQAMIQESVSRYEQFDTVQDYVCQVNGELEDLLLRETPIPERAWLPSSPESASPPRVAPIYRDPLPGTVPKRMGPFKYPPLKRARTKTSQEDAEGAVARDLETREGNFEADEEAAKHLDN